MSSSQPGYGGRSSAPGDAANTLRQFHSEAFAESVKAPAARIMHQSTVTGWRCRPSDRLEIMLGRGLAACVHPFTAWRLCSPSWRLWILTAYAAAGYVVVLGVLFVLGSA